MIVIDALRFDTACSHMGFMQHLVEQGKMARYEVKSEVPSLSRPLYETILTNIQNSSLPQACEGHRPNGRKGMNLGQATA